MPFRLLFSKYILISLISTSLPVNSATAQDDRSATSSDYSTATLHAQVLLDRLHISPGAIDGFHGRNIEFALKAFQENRLNVTGKLDEETSKALLAAWTSSSGDKASASQSVHLELKSFVDSAPDPAESPVARYEITEEDAGAEFAEIPEKMEDKAKLAALHYEDLKEMLAERFHASVSLLERLNPDAEWKAEETILVPNVIPTRIRLPEEKIEKSKNDSDIKPSSPQSQDTRNNRDSETPDSDVKEQHKDASSGQNVQGPLTVLVSKEDTNLSVVDKNGELVFHAPVSAGSEHDPLPLGEWKVNGTETYPKFHYNPDLFWDAEEDDSKAKIPAGPNNPVGVAWIDISKPHYGLHGTPEPEKIGYTQSHGCVRLTNWDVIRLSKLVKPGVKVYFVETADERIKMAREIKEKQESEEDAKDE